MSFISEDNVQLTRNFSMKPKIPKKTNLFRVSLLILLVLQIPCRLRNVNDAKNSYWNALKILAPNPSEKFVPTCQYQNTGIYISTAAITQNIAHISNFRSKVAVVTYILRYSETLHCRADSYFCKCRA